MTTDYEGEDSLALEWLCQHLETLGPFFTISTVIQILQDCPDSISRPYSQNFVTER